MDSDNIIASLNNNKAILNYTIVTVDLAKFLLSVLIAFPLYAPSTCYLILSDSLFTEFSVKHL